MYFVYFYTNLFNNDSIILSIGIKFSTRITDTNDFINYPTVGSYLIFQFNFIILILSLKYYKIQLFTSGELSK